jgi:hypothetical protein
MPFRETSSSGGNAREKPNSRRRLGGVRVDGDNRRRAADRTGTTRRDSSPPHDTDCRPIVAPLRLRGEVLRSGPRVSRTEALKSPKTLVFLCIFAAGLGGTSRAARPPAMTRVAPPTSLDHDWSSVSELRPCPVCGSPSRCSVHADGAFASCSREQSEWPLTNGSWLHRIALVDSVVTRSPAAIVAEAPATSTKAWVTSSRP